MGADLVPRKPKRKKQPSAECYREQLRLAADEIIRLRTVMDGVRFAAWDAPFTTFARPPWWQRIFRRSQ